MVFIEDDVEVLRYFLDTELATTILNDKQVFIHYLDWNDDLTFLESLISGFFLHPYTLSALAYYAGSKSQEFEQVKIKISYFTNFRLATAQEYLSYSKGFFANFYRNLLLLPGSYLGNSLFGKFKEVPAIICGAGPSLEKNIEVLKTLKDRALIFAGGTALNALNAHGLQPHFGLGIDPNIYQFSRLIANKAFEVPFFYRNRMNHEAFQTIHGDRLYITGAGGYTLADWFEKKVGIEGGPPLSEGHNVVNFSLSVAHALGCNPIILVGVDLAYSNNQSYSSGIVYHAIHDPKYDFRTKTSQEELLLKNDIDGKPVNTLWKWVNESFWFSNFATANPQATLYNSTEGGIGFAGIPNIPLAEVAEKHLTRRFDFVTRLHGEIQNSRMPTPVTTQNLLESVQELYRSLERCREDCSRLREESHAMIQEALEGKALPTDLLSEKAAKHLEELKQEVGYLNLLVDFDNAYQTIHNTKFEIESREAFSTPNEINAKKAKYIFDRYTFLNGVANFNINLISFILNHFIGKIRVPMPSPPPKTAKIMEDLRLKRLKNLEEEKYEFEKDFLRIIDPELGIAFEEKVAVPLKEARFFYPSGKLKMEEYYDENGLLHGPSSYYKEEGSLLAQCWFIHGKRQGKGTFYYIHGGLSSVQRYKDDRLHGYQEFYFANSVIKSILNYYEGQLDGEVLLFFPHGKPKRELHFVNNKREGPERLWNESGLLIIEGEYKQDKPVGMARAWYSNGNIAKELTYGQDSLLTQFRAWDEAGHQVAAPELEREDYFDKVTSQTGNLTDSLEMIMVEIDKFIPLLTPHLKKTGTDIEKMHSDIEKLRKEISLLRKAFQDLNRASGRQQGDFREPIWKSTPARRIIEKQLELAASKMALELMRIKISLAQTVGSIQNKIKEDEQKQ